MNKENRIIQNIDVNIPDNNESIYITIDIDWAADEILSFTIDLIEDANIPVTWFVTHKTPLIERLNSNPKFEIGIHPNFNGLFWGDFSKGNNIEDIIQKNLDIVPEARSVRSHGLTQSTDILDLFSKYELTHNCNIIIPWQANIEVKPWLLWNGITNVPHFWEDDVECIYKTYYKMEDLLKRKGLKVFDFHPIHIFLNTEDLDRYEMTRPIHKNASLLSDYRNKGVGSCTKLLELITNLKNTNCDHL